MTTAEQAQTRPGPLREAPRADVSTLASLRAMQSDPLNFLTGLRERHGSVVRFALGPAAAVLVSDPELIQRVLVTANHDFGKGFGRLGTRPGRQPISLLLGHGLLTSNGDFHRQQRRLIQPVFHRERIAGYGETFAALSDEAAAGWRDGTPIDVHQAMTDLTFGIVTRTLFDIAPDERITTIVGRALHDGMRMAKRARLPLAEVRRRLPLPANRRWLATRAALWDVVDRMIDERRRAPDLDARTDLLSLLVAVRDEDTGEPMDPVQVRDEALTIMLAGHETTANALTWTFHLLADHPEVTAAMNAEVDEVLGGRLPTAADLPRLKYTDRVLTEAMRLYPPAWMTVRRAVTPQQLGPYLLPAGATVVISPYVVHRDPALHPDPERFDPDRWLPERSAGRHRLAYLPFGSGPRKCIGDGFARMEGVLALATIARRWSFRRPPGAAAVGTLPLVTLRPRGPLPLIPVARR